MKKLKKSVKKLEAYTAKRSIRTQREHRNLIKLKRNQEIFLNELYLCIYNRRL